MKTRAYMLVMGGLLMACAPLSIYYKPGVSVARQQADTTRCEVKALQDAPVANEIRQGAPIYYPGGRYCRSGTCWNRPGYWHPGPIYTVDANKNLRVRVTDMCMAEKGYQPASIPPCSQSIRSQARPGATTTLPQLTPNSCFIRNDDGSYQVVTPQIVSIKD